MRRLLPLAFALAALLTAPRPAAAQGFVTFNDRNHPELRWREAETPHFLILYPDRLEGIEAEAAAVAEATYEALSATLGVTFDRKIRVYLSDEDEIANGLAVNLGRAGFTNIWVNVNEAAEIWTGDAKWLRKVLAHEIAHIFHFRAIRSRWGLAENLIADPIPSFWAEGLAQYLTERWDAQRGDRWLRTAAFEGRLSYTDGTSAQNGRLLYASGNSQVRFLAERYGDSTIVKLLRHRTPTIPGMGGVHDFYRAFRATLGKPYAEFYEEWRKHVGVHYFTQAGQMERLDSLRNRPLPIPGQVVYDVAFSPDTLRLAATVLTSLDRPVRRLYVMNNPGRLPPAQRQAPRARGVRVLAEGAFAGPIAWHPDGQRIAYARTVRGRHGSLLNDLFEVDVASGRERRLTRNRRALSPTYSPDGARLAFVGSAGGTANLFLLDPATGDETPLTRYAGDVQITSARWQPGGNRIAYAVFDADGRRALRTVDVATGEDAEWPTGLDVPLAFRDDRNPVWRPDGGALAYTSLRDLAPNVFSASAPAPRTPALAAALTAAARPAAAPETMLAGMATADTATADTATADTATADAMVTDRRARAAGATVRPVPRLETPPAPEETRRTALFGGATLLDWLPPDSLHADGRFVLLASETKRRDRVFVVDAARRPALAPDSAAVPAAYAAWTTHQPPFPIADDIPPDPSLILRRGPYRSLRNLTHALTLPLPYLDPEQNDYGVFATSLWLEPLAKHQLFLLGGVSVTRFSDMSFLLAEYVNRQLKPTISVSLYRFPSPSSFYGGRLLVENLTGGDVSATLPLDVTTRPFRTLLAGARLRYAYAEPYELDRFTELDAAGGSLPLPQKGFRADAQLGLAYKFQRPYRLNVIDPLDGTGVRLRVTAGAPVLGADNRFVRPDLTAYHITRPIGFGRLFVRGRATAQFGRQLAQDYVGLSRFDDIDVQVPLVGALTLDDAERVRGYRRYAVGTRVLFGSAEYRLGPLFDLQTNLLGVLRLGPVAPALFVDGAMVWTGANYTDAVRRTGFGAELKNALTFGGFSVLQAVGVGVPWSRAERLWEGTIRRDEVDVYYRVQAAVPF
ncbi:MAG: hypothetical protein ACK41D_01105 [Rubricoccaceae bacterium]